MTNDADWVAEVRRWYFAGTQAKPAAQAAETESAALGYEAAHPALQSAHWPDAPRDVFNEPGLSGSPRGRL